MTTYVHRTLIVPAEHAVFARTLATTLEPVAAGDMWLTGLSPTGSAPATHYVSAGMVGEEFAPILADADALWAAVQAALAAGMVLPPKSGQRMAATESEAFGLPECQAIIAASDVSEEPPFDAFAQLGLQLVQQVDV